MKKDLVTSVVCTVVFGLLWFGCGGGDGSGVVIGAIGGRVLHVAQRSLAGTAIYSGSGVNTQAMFQVSTPVVLSQSFHGVCKIPTTLSPTVGFLVPITGFGLVGSDNCSTFFSQAQPGIGERMLDDGTVSTLVVLGGPAATAQGGTVTLYVNGVASPISCSLGTGTRCDDRAHTVLVKNNDLVQPYLIQGAGDKISDIEVLFLKQ